MAVIALVILALSLVFAPFIKNRLGNSAPVCLFLIACLICEVFCFNFESFRSKTYPEIDNYVVSSSMNVKRKDSSFILSDPADYIEINYLTEEVKNIYIKTNTTMHTIRFFVADGANDNRYHAGDVIVSRYSDLTSYIKTNFTGQANQIRLYIPDIGNRIVTLSDIRINCAKPFYFSFLRVGLCFFILLFIYYIILRRDLWKKVLDFSDKSQKNLIVGIVCVIMALFTAVPFINPGFISPPWPHHNQYNDLAEAFLQGQLHLEKEVPDILLEMENPYDRVARKEAFAKAKITEPWDTAFYDGKFYVYFGVLPVFLFYLPAQLLGFDFPNFLAIVFFSWVLVLGIFLLYAHLVKKFFDKIPLLFYLILSSATALSAGVFYLIKRPDFYSVPIMGALAFTVMGLYFWFSSIPSDGEKLSRTRLFIGSVFMASVIALRPNLVFFSCAAFILYWNSVFTHRELLSINSRVSDEKWRGLKNTLAFCMPYIVFGGLVMVYNYLRFDSPFDFGAAYNLTTSDMTQRGFSIDRWGMGVFEYLVSPPNISATFPYLTSSMPATTYIGFTSSEGMFGGIFITQPILWAMFAIHKAKHKKPFVFTVFLIVTSFVICLLDIQAGGVLPRYTSDFALFFVIAAVLVTFMLYAHYPNVVTKFASWSLLFMILWDLLLIIAGGSSTIQNMNKGLYMWLYSQLGFFL